MHLYQDPLRREGSVTALHHCRTLLLDLRGINHALSCLSLFQCPRINGIKAYTKEIDRRQVVLDLQIW